MREPEVSVITAHSPGREEFLLEAYKSLLAQDFTNWQWLIEGEEGINTPDFLSDPRTSWRANPPGLAVAIKRNHALLDARAPYICILDDDDILPPDSLSSRLQELKKYPQAAFLMSNAGDLGDPSFVIKAPPFMEGLVSKGAFYQTWRERKEAGIPGATLTPSSLLWRKEVLWEIAGWHALRKGEDTAMMIHASLLYPAVYLNKITYLLRKHPGRLTKDKSRVAETISWINQMAEAIIGSDQSRQKHA